MIAMSQIPISEKKRNERSLKVQDCILVGIDPACYKHTAVIYTPSRTAIAKVHNINNNRKGFQNFENRLMSIKKLYPNIPIKLAIEASGEYWKPFQHYFRQRGMETIFVPPLFVKRTRDLDDFTPRSNDPKDAVRIANLAFEGRYFIIEEQSDVFENLRHLVRTWDIITDQLTRCQHRIQSYLASYFPEFNLLFSSVVGVTSLAVLEHWPFPQDLCQVTAEQMNEMIKKKMGNGHVDKEKTTQLLALAQESVGISNGIEGARIRIGAMIEQAKFYKKQLAELRKTISHTLNEIYYSENIKSVFGIGAISIAQFLGYLGDLYNYQKVKQILDLAGLSLIATESGTFKSKQQISHRGRKNLRRVLYEMTLHFLRAPGTARLKYLKCRIKGKTHRQAVIACIPILIKIIFAVVKQNRKYIPLAKDDPMILEIKKYEKLVIKAPRKKMAA